MDKQQVERLKIDLRTKIFLIVSERSDFKDNVESTRCANLFLLEFCKTFNL